MNVADPVIVPLYPATYPAVIPAEKQEKAVNNVGFINNIHYPTLDVYLPAAGQATGCGVVICPGGGYTGLASDHEGKQIARWLNSFGVAGFVLKYRLPPDYRHPIPMQDAQRGLRVVRANAAKWNVNPQRIGVLGFSAGGHLASTVTTHFDGGNPQAADAVERQSCRPDFSVLCYAVICFAKEYCHSGSRINLLGDTLPGGRGGGGRGCCVIIGPAGGGGGGGGAPAGGGGGGAGRGGGGEKPPGKQGARRTGGGGEREVKRHKMIFGDGVGFGC